LTRWGMMAAGMPAGDYLVLIGEQAVKIMA
jgi:hypothetical protein